MRAPLLALLVAAAPLASTAATPPSLSPQTQAVIAPVHEAIVKARAEIAALPLPKDDIEKLRRMKKLDQAPRSAFGSIDFSRIPSGEKDEAMRAIGAQMTPIDQANQKALLEMVPSDGWFSISRYGREGSAAAFLIVQHGNVDLWRRFVPILAPLVEKGEIKGADYALMFDRLAISEGRPQRYGSQIHCVAGKYEPFPIEDPDHLDALRAAMNLPPYADYLAPYASKPPC